MQTSKLLFTKFILTLSLFSLAACNLPTPKDREGNNAATFNIESVKGSALEEQTTGTFALPTSKVFNFVVCLKDVAYNRTIQGHKFMIEEVSKEVTTDTAGCLNWSEAVKYNYLGESEYVQIERHIRGTGFHKGTRDVSIAINPWSHGEDVQAVLDPTKNEIPKFVDNKAIVSQALHGFSADNQLKTRSLWLEEGFLFVNEQKLTANGVDLLVEVRTVPAILLNKMNGELVQRPLTAGSFKARFKMIHTYTEAGKEIHRLLAQSPIIEAKMENASLALKSTISMSVIPTRGQLILGIELQPVDGPEGLTAFDGVFQLGDYDQIKGSSRIKISSEVTSTKDFKVDHYINAQLTSATTVQSTTGQSAAGTSQSGSTASSTGLTGTTQTIGGAIQSDAISDDTYQRPKIEVADLSFKAAPVGNETTTMQQRYITVTACFKSGIDQKAIRAQTFKITKFRQNMSDVIKPIPPIKTDNTSCVSWDESFTYEYNECHHYIKGFIQIENPDLGMNEKIDIAVNPWEGAARDLRHIDAGTYLPMDCKTDAGSRPHTQVMLANYVYSNLSYNNPHEMDQIDSFLNMTIAKKLQFTLLPYTLAYSNLSSGRGNGKQDLRDGIYLVKMAIVKNRDYDDNNNTYVAHDQKFVNVLGSQISTDFTFRTQDLKAMGARNNLLIEIYPVDESKVVVNGKQINLKTPGASLDSAIDTKSQLESPTFVGPIMLGMDEASRPLTMLDPAGASNYFIQGSGNLNSSNNGAGKGTIGKIIAQGEARKAAVFAAAKARGTNIQFANENNLDLINVHTADAKAPLRASLKIAAANERMDLSRDELQSIVDNAKLSDAIALKLCYFWVSDYLPRMYAAKGGALAANSRFLLSSDCYNSVRNNPETFFQIKKRLAVREIGESHYVKGFSDVISIGTNFMMAHSTSSYKTNSFSVKGGLSKKFLDLFSLGADYSVTWSNSEGNGTNNAISVNTQTNLNMEQNQYVIRANKYEECTMVTLNPTLFIKSTSWFGSKDYINLLNPKLTPAEMAVVSTRGLMLCDGQVRTQALNLTENYYTIQQFLTTSTQDAGDDRNRNFFVALRSKNDFENFMIAIKGESKAPDSSAKEKNLQAEETTLMERLFKNSGPAYPGMFLIK